MNIEKEDKKMPLGNTSPRRFCPHSKNDLEKGICQEGRGTSTLQLSFDRGKKQPARDLKGLRFYWNFVAANHTSMSVGKISLAFKRS
ncbi:MAG: hypothetical protein C4582_07580 [Desulfobacteraceae bacterium]|nr:MAG: hypothetical protein C4582_07580 [Desulfobacteraceae bacterium]